MEFKEHVTFTEQQMYILIDALYGHDEIFVHIARGRVQRYLANGLEIHERLIFELIDIAKRWCRKRVEAK